MERIVRKVKVHQRDQLKQPEQEVLWLTNIADVGVVTQRTLGEGQRAS